MGFTLEVEGDGDVSALHDAIWEIVEGWIDMYTAGTSYRAATAYLRDEAIPAALDNDLWGASGTTLSFMFDALNGTRNDLADAWRHWVELALASEWNRVRDTAEELDLEITTPRFIMRPLLVGALHLLPMRDALWVVHEDDLSCDGERIAVADLDPGERGRVDEARTRCMCGPCTMLRPEPSFENGLLGGLSDPDSASSAAWYIARWQRNTPEVLLALVHAAGEEIMRGEIERYAENVPDAAAGLLAVLATLTGVERARAMYALSSVKLDPAQRAQLLAEVRVSLAETGVAANAAAEVAGLVRGEDPALYDTLADILDRDVPDELRHQVVLGLVNAHLERVPSPAVRERLEHEATRNTEAGKLAAWFLRSFATKT